MSKTGECCSYQTAQLGHGNGRRKKIKTGGEEGSYRTAHVRPINGVVNVGVVLSFKHILNSWQLCLPFKLDVHRYPQLKEI